MNTQILNIVKTTCLTPARPLTKKTAPNCDSRNNLHGKKIFFY